jgi:hypothetical protein
MQQIKKLLKLGRLDYYETHLSLINCVLPVKLTPMEITVLAAFMSLEGDIAEYRFGPSAKKLIMNRLNLKPSGLSNYLKQLKDKEALTERGDVIHILPILHPEKDQQDYMFRLINIDSVPLNAIDNATVNS